jgi:hypothetical protein
MVKPLADAWAKFNRAKVHAQETKTGVMLFEEPLKAIDKDNFLGKYFVPPGEFQRPGIPMTF